MHYIWRIIFIGLFIYFIYHAVIRSFILKYNYIRKGIQLTTNKNYTDIELFEELKYKGFNYPDMKNLRLNEAGKVVIEGKYSGHEITIDGNVISIDAGNNGFFKNDNKCIEETKIINAYIEKTLDITSPIDPYVKYKKFKRAKYINIFVVLCCIIIAIYSLYSSNDFKSQVSVINSEIKSSGISNQYLTKYSEDVTIGKAFNNFFTNPNWESYEIGIQKYVDFQGGCQYDGEDATAVITFAVFDDYFSVDSVKINGNDIDLLEIDGMLNIVFNDNKSTSILMENEPKLNTQDTKTTEEDENQYSLDNTIEEIIDDKSIYTQVSDFTASDFIGATLKEVIGEFGDDYSINNDNGRYYLSYPNFSLPYIFFFVPLESENDGISLYNTVTAVEVYNGGYLFPEVHVGMTLDEINNLLGTNLNEEDALFLHDDYQISLRSYEYDYGYITYYALIHDSSGGI